jgi:hypothetical protein
VDTFIFSTGVSNKDIRQYYTKNFIPVYNDWDDIVIKLLASHKKAKVAIYPLASMQIGYLDEE